MDTGTHILLGLTLGGLAYLDPTVSQNPTLAEGLLIGTIIGSNVPDIDTIVRVKGYDSYIKHHRGLTHSMLALIIWPVILALPIMYNYHLFDYWGTLYTWILIAATLHVVLDLLNSYGVQVLQPYSKEWIHFDIISIFDPFIFTMHLIGAFLWLILNFEPGKLFLAIYLITLIYILLRITQHHFLVRRVKQKLDLVGVYHVVPTFNWFYWRFIIEVEDKFCTGQVAYNKIILESIYTKEERNRIIEATMQTDGVRTFLSFAQRIHVTWKELQDGYYVSWSDVRFWYNKKLPFGVDIVLDKNLNVVNEKVGWRKKTWSPPYE